jgi:hypothetical protein
MKPLQIFCDNHPQIELSVHTLSGNLLRVEPCELCLEEEHEKGYKDGIDIMLDNS